MFRPLADVIGARIPAAAVRGQQSHSNFVGIHAYAISLASFDYD
jgi:hypothetical protein